MAVLASLEELASLLLSRVSCCAAPKTSGAAAGAVRLRRFSRATAAERRNPSPSEASWFTPRARAPRRNICNAQSNAPRLAGATEWPASRNAPRTPRRRDRQARAAAIRTALGLVLPAADRENSASLYKSIGRSGRLVAQRRYRCSIRHADARRESPAGVEHGLVSRA